MGNEALFREKGVWRAIIALVVPSVLTILIMVVYNIADMFFISMLGDDDQVAAVAVVGPIFSLATAVATMIGAGGCAVIARTLGAGDREQARTLSSLCIWAAIGFGAVFTLLLLSATAPILRLLGATENLIPHAGTYMRILWRIFLRHRWWWLVLPVVVCLALTFVDMRFAFVALIVAMGMVMIAMPLVYYYALTQESRWSILEKTITITAGGLQLSFTDDKMREHVIGWNEMDSTTALNECLIIRLKKNRYTFLAIPLSAFTTQQQLRDFVIKVKHEIKPLRE